MNTATIAAVFLIGMMAGAVLGMLSMALLVAAGRADEREDLER